MTAIPTTHESRPVAGALGLIVATALVALLFAGSEHEYLDLFGAWGLSIIIGLLAAGMWPAKATTRIAIIVGVLVGASASAAALLIGGLVS